MRKEPQFIVNIGKPDSGKTEWNQMNLHTFSEDTGRVLFLDLKNETEYLEVENLIDFCRDKNQKGTYRVNFRGLGSEEREALYRRCVQNFVHGVIFVGNPYAIFEFIPLDIIDNLMPSRTFRKTVVMDLHKVKEFTHPKIIAHANVVNLFRTESPIKSIDKIKTRLGYHKMKYESFIRSERILNLAPTAIYVKIDFENIENDRIELTAINY